MTNESLPKIHPRIREASEQYFQESIREKRVRLALLKKQFSNGTYNPNTAALAKSLAECILTG